MSNLEEAMKNVKPTIGVNRSRRGRMVIDEEALLHDAEAAKALMSRVVVVKCDYNLCTRQLEYWVYCDDFEPLADGYMSHTYEPIFTRHDDKTITIEFRKAADR